MSGSAEGSIGQAFKPVTPESRGERPQERERVLSPDRDRLRPRMPSSPSSAAELQGAAKTRFRFGENWHRFLSIISEERIQQAEQSLYEMLRYPLVGKSFIDIGSGSGLFSLAARRLGASVHSFDYDPVSVACTLALRQRYFADDPLWTVEQGSVLDLNYVSSLPKFDVVYSWGVLHHTGSMWRALENVERLVKDEGILFISIYNDQGKRSLRWKRLKRIYNLSPRPVQFMLALGVCVTTWWKRWLKDLLHLRPFQTWRLQGRGMSAWRDVVDWTGGYPFEVAKPERIFEFYRQRGFILERLQTDGGGLGCNQFVFSKPTQQSL